MNNIDRLKLRFKEMCEAIKGYELYISEHDFICNDLKIEIETMESSLNKWNDDDMKLYSERFKTKIKELNKKKKELLEYDL